ncbi:hypothetical protein V9T40_013365 [Parthenolecanium corni]|uniref:RNA-directed DNA polymerase n=1 Tax=Parthenolecanium corni TaxID=536013 RepID=A0AAN9TJ01_9HEMI
MSSSDDPHDLNETHSEPIPTRSPPLPTSARHGRGRGRVICRVCAIGPPYNPHMCPNDPNLDTSRPLVQHSPVSPIAKRTRQSTRSANLFGQNQNAAIQGESSNAGNAMETESINTAAVSNVASATAAGSTAAGSTVAGSTVATSTVASTTLPEMTIPPRLLQNIPALNAQVNDHQPSNLTNSNVSDFVTSAQFTNVVAQFNSSLTAIAQQINTMSTNMLGLAQVNQSRSSQSNSRTQTTNSSNPPQSQNRLFWRTNPPPPDPPDPDSSGDDSSDDDRRSSRQNFPPRMSNPPPSRRTNRVAVRTVFEYFRGEENLSLSFKKVSIDIGSSIAENMTKLMMRKKKIDPFVGENDHRTVCEFLRIYDRNYTSLEDSDIRCEILRNNICDKACSWVIEEYVVSMKYAELAEYLLKLYWDEDTRNQVWMRFKQEVYSLTGPESFSNYVTSRYYRLRDTRMVSEEKLIKEFQHKCPSTLALILTPDCFSSYKVLMDKLMSPEVRKHEELRKQSLRVGVVVKRNLFPNYKPQATSTASASASASTTTIEAKKPPYRFFNRRSVNELTAEGVHEDLACHESMENDEALAQPLPEEDDQYTDSPIEYVAEIAQPSSIAKPSSDPVAPKWKDFEIFGDFLAKSFFQGDAGNSNFNSANNRVFDYSLCGDGITLDNFCAKLRASKRKFGRKFLLMFSGHELIRMNDKEKLVDQLKALMVEMFEHHQVNILVIAKPLPLPEKEETYWANFSVINTIYYRALSVLPETYRKKVLLFDTFKAVGRLSQEKERKNNLYFVCTDGTPRLIMSAGNFQTVQSSASADQHLTWSTAAIKNASKQLSERIEMFSSATQAARKPVKINKAAIMSTSVAEISSSAMSQPVAQLNSISEADQPESDADDFLGIASINVLDAVASICWSSDEDEDEESSICSNLSSLSSFTASSDGSSDRLCIQPQILHPRKIIAHVGLTRAEIFCDDGSANSFVSKDFVERVIRENPNLKIVSFPQKPVSYGLGEPGKFMRNVDKNTMFPVKLTSTSGATFEFDLIAEMPQTFGHDIMFGRNVYSHLKINFNYDASTMTFGVPELKGFEIPITIPFPTINEVSASSDLHTLIDEVVESICMPAQLRKKFKQLLKDQIRLFDETNFGCCSVYTHDFTLTEEKAKNYQVKFYPIPQSEKEKFRVIIERWLRSEIIRHSSSQFRSPILMVKKKDGDRRPCVDFRELNKMLEVRGETVPLISELKTRFHGATIFSKLDFKEGFLQIPLSENSKQFTAFSFEGEIYEFNRTPFGTQQSSQSFIRALQVVFSGMQTFVALYVDDLLIFSPDMDTHLEHLSLVFERIASANMTLNLKKCTFYKSEVPYLGFIISDEGVKTDPERVQGILNMAQPTEISGLRSFLGFVGFYRDHIPSFAIIAEPLYRLTRPSEKYIWTDLQERSFALLKQKVADEILLTHPDFTQPFYLQTDASAYGIGGYVYQMRGGGETSSKSALTSNSSAIPEPKPVIIALCSRLLNKAERNYGTYERELLALVYTLKKFYYMLIGHRINWLTDHKALLHVKAEANFKERINRWRLELQNFNIENICYVPGVKNQIADILSRFHKKLIPDVTALYHLPSINAVNIVRDNNGAMEVADIIKNFHLHQLADLDCRVLIQETMRGNLTRFKIEDNVLLYQNRDGRFRAYVPFPLRHRFIEFYHQEAAHVGVVKTVNVIRRYFDWPGLAREVRDYVKACDECSLCKRRNFIPQGPQYNVIALKRNEYLAMDYFGPLPGARAGLSKILVIMDMFTKFVRLYPVKFATTEATINAVKKHLAEYGDPKRVLTDNGRQFDTDVWRNFWKSKDVEVTYISAYRPSSNPVERVMSTLGDMLRLYSRDSHRRWPMLISDIETRINNVEHTTTEVPPVALQLKKFPAAHDQTELTDLSEEKYLEFCEIARKNILKHIRLRNEYFDRTHRKTIVLTPGHVVYVKSHHLSDKSKGEAKKLFPLFEGPYIMAQNQPQNPAPAEPVAVPVYPAAGCNSCTNYNVIIRRVCATNNDLTTKYNELCRKYAHLKLELQIAQERGTRYKNQLYRLNPSLFPGEMQVASPPRNAQPMVLRAPAQDIDLRDVPPPPPPGPAPIPAPLPPMEVDVEPEYQPTPRVPFEQQLAQERDQVLVHLQNLPSVNEINRVLGIPNRPAEPVRRVEVRQPAPQVQQAEQIRQEVQQIMEQARQQAAQVPQQPAQAQQPIPVPAPAAMPQPQVQAQPIAQPPAQVPIVQQQAPVVQQQHQLVPAQNVAPADPLPPRPVRRSLISNPLYIPAVAHDETYEERRERGRQHTNFDLEQTSILYAHMVRENEELDFGDLIRFAPIIVQYGLFGHPAATYFYVESLRRRVRVVLDTRIGATSMATFSVFRNERNISVNTRPQMLHYHFVHPRFEVVHHHAHTVIQLAHNGRFIPVVLGLTRDWTIPLLVIALDVIAPYISELDVLRQRFALNYNGVECEHQFFWQTDQLLMSNRPVDQMAANELEKRNNDVRNVAAVMNHPVRHRGNPRN